MKITALQKCLENMMNRFGDIEVKILNDESGEMEPVAAVFHFSIGGAAEDHVELCTADQCGDFPEGQTIVVRG